ncbi:hypothetical protein [Methylobacterium sp. ID0610]|uniref:hypothetical protein n=1 Tax=Methylobacterium carpenticola TaxID=3344827 RepID=UPI003683A873
MVDTSAEILRSAIEATRSDSRLVELSKAIWQGHAAGALGDNEAQALAEHVHARRTALRGPQTAPMLVQARRRSIFSPKRPQRSPDRTRSLERRRTLAASGAMPPAVAAHFTTGEQAALRIVLDEIRDQGECMLCLDAIAARAGVSASTARNGIREAKRLGLLSVEERRRPGQRNLPNVIRVLDTSLRAWITKGGRVRTDRRSPGFKFQKATENKDLSTCNRSEQQNRSKGYRGLRLECRATQKARSRG